MTTSSCAFDNSHSHSDCVCTSLAATHCDTRLDNGAFMSSVICILVAGDGEGGSCGVGLDEPGEREEGGRRKIEIKDIL